MSYKISVKVFIFNAFSIVLVFFVVLLFRIILNNNNNEKNNITICIGNQLYIGC